ncbi:long-chain-fatty-acid--CoA ligase [bacterium BMS3Abin03]|nr:long-chain-fatty-acid--CoA ligase [bacterium BMS3Abin03]
MKKKSHRLTIDELEEFLKHDLANYKIPQKIFYEKELPRSELGKVLRSKLIDKYSLD